jgi:hypothetical protein
MANEYRVSSITFEILSSGDAAARVSQIAIEALTSGDAEARVSSCSIEVLRSITTTTSTRRRMSLM